MLESIEQSREYCSEYFFEINFFFPFIFIDNCTLVFIFFFSFWSDVNNSRDRRRKLFISIQSSKNKSIYAYTCAVVSSLFLFYLKVLSVFLLIRMHLFPILISNNNIRNFKLQIFHIVNSLATDLIWRNFPWIRFNVCQYSEIN